MEALLNKRKVLKGRVTRIETVANGHINQPLSTEALKLYVEKLGILTSEVDEMQTNIANQCTEQEFDIHDREYNELIGRIETVTILFMTAINQEPITVQPQVSPRIATDIKLPRLELPVFHGEYEKWIPFHDMFSATIHNNTALSGAQKLQYLKSSLRDEAAILIQSIPMTDANYNEAWEILNNRFNNNREIIDAHIKRLFAQPNIVQESSAALRRLIDTTIECVRALKVLQEPVQHWDAILVHVIKERLDQESRRQWELSLQGTRRPTFEEFSVFLDQRARALAAAQSVATSAKTRENTQFSTKLRTAAFSKQTKVHHGVTQNNCVICKGHHTVFKCPIFVNADFSERQTLVRKHHLCFNCLKQDHQVQDCKASHCKKCAQKHNTLLHRSDQQLESTATLAHQVETSDVVSHISRQISGPRQVLLSTAIIQIQDIDGQFHPFRALLDSASQASFITERCAQRLRLKRKHDNISISGIGASRDNTCHGSVDIAISSRFDQTFKLSVHALILPRVTGLIPSFDCSTNEYPHLKRLQLADPIFHTPSEIDVLLGADVFFDILQTGHCKGAPGTPSAFNTVFGWTITGQVDGHHVSSMVSTYHCNIDDQLKRFWEIEELPAQKFMTKEEIQCEQHFKDTHTRDTTGRYVVRLPFRTSSHQFGDSKKIAVRRFLQVERRLQADVNRYAEYKAFMNEYQALGHMSPISAEEIERQPNQVYYLPHHAVIKESSTTTRLRVVFDASAKANTGISLNDELLVGPKQQDDLLNLLVRFRKPIIAMKADLAKMYRQIKVHDEDTDFQRIVWRNDPSEPLQEFQLLTVTYGTASAPYLATRVLKQLAEDEGPRIPQAAPVLANDFFVDDLMTGADSVGEALTLQQELIELTQQGGFELRKWASNESSLLESLPIELREVQPSLKFESDSVIKTLGLHWQSALDQFSFVLTPSASKGKPTKRTILSDTARVFDPLGLVSPTLIRAKLILQELWQHKIEWDDSLPDLLEAKWQAFCEDIPHIEAIRIQRCISQQSAQSISLHGFCDASEKAYAAVVYMHSTSTSGKVRVQLIASKTRVAPLKTTTIPRLELCSAVLLTRLIKLIQESLKCDLKEIHAWSDSTIVLAWVSAQPQRWKTFVANRVAEIQDSLPSAQWHHVVSEENPADSASRGVTALESRGKRRIRP